MVKASMGLEPNVAGLLCYVLFWISGLLFFVLEKDSEFVRFHAIQSMVTFGALTVVFALNFIPVIGWLFGYLIWALGLVLWIILMIKAYQGQRYKLPWAGKIAAKQAWF